MSFQISRATTTINLKLPDPTHWIYRFHCLTTDKMYIGMTKDPERRIQEHLDGKGSNLILRALVDYGINDFNIQIIDSIHSDCLQEALDLEDRWILKYNSLHPLGFNMRLNAAIVPNDDPIYDRNGLSPTITISAKYVFQLDNKLIFTVGEFTQSRNYQLLTNVIKNLKPKGLALKKKVEFRYIEVRITSDRSFLKDETYELELRINDHNRLVLNKLNLT